MTSTRSLVAVFGLTLTSLFGSGQVAASPALLGQTIFSGATGAAIDIDPNGDLVYIASGFGQTGWIRINAANPGAMTQAALAGGWGGGVAVDPVTGRYASTSGFGAQFQIFNANDTVRSTGGISGCGGSVAYDGGRFGVSTQCSDHIAIFDETSGAMLANIATGGVGSTVNHNPATGNFYQNRSGTSSLVVSPTFSTSSLGGGGVQDANGVTNRVYFSPTSGGTQVLDGSTHAVLASIAQGGEVDADTLLNRFYIGAGSAISVFDGITNGLIDSILLPAGQTFQTMGMADGDDRLYVITSGGGLHLLVYETGGASAPEPASLALLAMGLLGLGINTPLVRRRVCKAGSAGRTLSRQ